MTIIHATDIDCATIGDLGLEPLRTIWRERFGAAPSIRSPEILALMLAWRIQAAREGGLQGDLRRTIRRPASAPVATALTPGTRLTREWQGVRHEVVVEPDGRLRHRDELHLSLSQVARKITGSRWNGPRFFGLRAGEEGA
ncbi:DUF2924 domain-containing protein [Brevundimonas sp. UBA7664]|uniref:DUF2924 domain-containing protein n=1 Tax=Brevundimonas sp. UBA7664 TaxID=1946141 RepID=UPI0025BA6E53|nr:DUF2924 domain-containing protein [Brevundimonas sp. UBA7664]